MCSHPTVPPLLILSISIPLLSPLSGFGSFVDKVALPYVSQVKAKKNNPCPNRLNTCQPAFSFQNILRLTEDADKFKTRVSDQIISGNLDSPEAGFDAIMQAAVCQVVSYITKHSHLHFIDWRQGCLEHPYFFFYGFLLLSLSLYSPTLTCLTPSLSLCVSVFPSRV